MPEGSAITAPELELVRGLLSDQPTWRELAKRLRGLDAGPAVTALADAFTYELVNAEQGEDRERVGVFAPMWTDPEGGANPPLPAQAKPELVAIWTTVAGAIDDPVVASRLRDLSFVRRPDERDAIAAAAALLQLAASGTWPAMDRASCVSRALELIGPIKAPEVRLATFEQAEVVFLELLQLEQPGSSMAGLAAFASAARGNRRPRPDVEPLVEAFVERWRGTDSAEQALELAARVSREQTTQRALRRDLIAVLRQQAAGQTGIAKAAHLQRAIQLATRYGFRDERDSLINELQAIPHDEMGFESFTVEVPVDVEAVKAEIDKLAGTGASSISNALSRIGAYGPSGGSDAEIEAEAPESWVMDVFGTQIFNEGSAVPTFVANEPEAKRRWRIAQHRTLHASSIGAHFYGPALMHARSTHGDGRDGELMAFFTTDLIGEDRAERFVRALQLFWDHEFDDAAHIAVPRIEATLREWARLAGLPISNPAGENGFGGWKTLGQLLGDLRKRYPDLAWLDYLNGILAEPLGPNLRNNIAHGITNRASPTDAALLIQVCCFLTHIRHQDDESDAPDDAEEL